MYMKYGQAAIPTLGFSRCLSDLMVKVITCPQSQEWASGHSKVNLVKV